MVLLNEVVKLPQVYLICPKSGLLGACHPFNEIEGIVMCVVAPTLVDNVGSQDVLYNF